MIKRIQLLRNIGRFKNCKPGNVNFGRLTILYGRNTYGKSTLGDILASICENIGSLITGRMTIPPDGEPQQISLSLLPSNSTKEVQLSFVNGSWSGSLPQGLVIRAFDDGFIHRNVFIGRQFNRDTKENFSAFVLGEQGVQQVKAVAEKKQQRQKASRERNNLKKIAFKDEGDLESFLKLSPTGTLEESDARLHSLQNEYAEVLKQQKQILTIQARKEGASLTWRTNFTDGLKQLNNTLGQGLEGTHKEAKAKVAEHISVAFEQDQGAELWIRQGVRQNKGSVCQFCGEELTEDAHKLLDLYREAFDTAYDKHDTTVKQQLSVALAQVNHLPIDEIRVLLATNTTAFTGYQELQSNQIFTSALMKLAESEESIIKTLDAIGKVLPGAIQRLTAACAKKQETPHIAIGPIDESSVSSLESQIQQLVSNYNALIEVCNAEIVSFKKDTNVTALNLRLDKIKVGGKTERRNNNRIKLIPQCNEYIELNNQINNLDKEILSLENQLQNNQSVYLETFFKSLNGWFQRFGSHDFTLVRGENKQGHTPIYYLKVQYKKHPIDEAFLCQVFSESDRRALALAVFWTQLQSIPEPALAEQIVVLDDPLTSFDDQRVTTFHRELAATIAKVRQIIVLSHYRHDIEMFFETFRNHPDVKLLTLVAGGANGTEIQNGDPREFILTEHQKAHERMNAFASGSSNDLSYTDLRIFFESELDSRFAAQITQHGLSSLQLGEKIEKLFEIRIIAEDLRDKCNTWRSVLNSPHHSWNEADLEDQRNTVRDFLNFIYNELIPGQ